MRANGYGFERGRREGARTAVVRGLHEARGWGRALWFESGGDAKACAATFADHTLAQELWRGVGTACAFAGDPRAHAIRLPALAGDAAAAVLAGALDAVALWRDLGTVPQRCGQVVESMAAARTSPTSKPRARAAQPTEGGSCDASFADRATILAGLWNDDRLLRELVHAWSEAAGERVATVGAAALAGDAEALGEAAHTLRCSALAFRAEAIVALADLLETRCRQHGVDATTRAWADELCDLCERLTKHLKETVQ